MCTMRGTDLIGQELFVSEMTIAQQEELEELGSYSRMHGMFIEEDCVLRKYHDRKLPVLVPTRMVD